MANLTSMPLNINWSIRSGAWIALIGFILSAPVAVALGTTLGRILYFAWNALMNMIMILIYQLSKNQPQI